MSFSIHTSRILGHKICWRVNRRCNLTCPHCLAGNLSCYSDEADTITSLNFVDLISVCGVTMIVFTGGEPLLRGDLIQILSKARGARIINQVTTNAIGLTEMRLTQFASCVDSLRISVDGFRDTHNSLRQSSSFDSVTDAISRAVHHGIQVVTNTVITRQNVQEIPALMRHLYDLGVRSFVLLRFMLRERGAKYPHFKPDERQLAELKQQLLDLIFSAPDLRIRVNNYGSKGDQYVVVESDGSVVLCSEEHPDIYFGNLRVGPEALRKALAQQQTIHRQLLWRKDHNHIARQDIISG